MMGCFYVFGERLVFEGSVSENRNAAVGGRRSHSGDRKREIGYRRGTVKFLLRDFFFSFYPKSVTFPQVHARASLLLPRENIARSEFMGDFSESRRVAGYMMVLFNSSCLFL